MAVTPVLASARLRSQPGSCKGAANAKAVGPIRPMSARKANKKRLSMWWPPALPAIGRTGRKKVHGVDPA